MGTLGDSEGRPARRGETVQGKDETSFHEVLLPAGGRRPEAADGRRVPYWSFSKTLIAAAALRLVDQGRLALDAPFAGRPYSLRHLLAHRAGLPDYAAHPAYRATVAADGPAWDDDRFLRETHADRLRSRPGAKFAYSNIGYLLLRRSIEAATGLGLGRAVGDLLLAPLGLDGITLAETRRHLDGVDLGALQRYDPGHVAHGLFVGPLDQAAAVLEAILGGTVLSATSRAAMQASQPVGERIEGRPWQVPGYGLGVMRGPIEAGFFMAGHTGSGPGSRIAVYRHEENGAVAAVFLPTDHAGDGPVEHRAMALLATSERR